MMLVIFFFSLGVNHSKEGEENVAGMRFGSFTDNGQESQEGAV